jgi:hypothetical protein
MVQYRWLEQAERPVVDEGFESVEVVPFVRRWPSEYRRHALIIELDGVVRRSRSKKRSPLDASDVLIDAERAEVLRRRAGEWDLIFGLAWLPEIAAKAMSEAAAEDAFRATEVALGVKLVTLHCPHGPGPAICWCRRPLPGLGVRMIREHALDPGACLMIGRSPQDRGFAARLGFRYQEAEAFFGRSLDLDGG